MPSLGAETSLCWHPTRDAPGRQREAILTAITPLRRAALHRDILRALEALLACCSQFKNCKADKAISCIIDSLSEPPPET